MTKYIEFKPVASPGKTQRFTVCNKKTGTILGGIGWYGPWRKYVFYATSATIFDEGCLSEIAAFIKEQTIKYKNKSNV